MNITNPEKYTKTNKQLTYSQIAKMALTHKRVDDGFRKKMNNTFLKHTSTSNDNILSSNFNKFKSEAPIQRNTKRDLFQTTSSYKNPLFGGNQIVSYPAVKLPPSPTIQRIQDFERKYKLPSDRLIQPHKKYPRNDSLDLSHIYEPGSISKIQFRSSSKDMKDLLSYRFASHSCQFVSPKITQSSNYLRRMVTSTH